MANGVRNLELAIQAINAGNPHEGARLINIAMRDQSMSNVNRARAYLWMAETSQDTEFKIRCYHNALALEPGNTFAQERLAGLTAVQQSASQPQIPLPPASQPVVTIGSQPVQTVTTPASQPVQPIMTPASQPVPIVSDALSATPASSTGMRISATFYRTIGIVDGPNGPGTGFFISNDGLLATTRYVVSGREHVTLELEPGRFISGKVVRSYIEFDLALVLADIDLSLLLPFTRVAVLPDNLDLQAFAHNKPVVRGRVRSTVRQIKPGWFPTTIRHVPDAGGGPIFDEGNQVVGMLTRNASRTSEDVYGLLIDPVLKKADEYRVEARMDSNREYCPNCGHLSRAAAVDAYYCEVCGGTLPHARTIARKPLPHMEAVYGENFGRPCRHCGSRVGIYNGLCLRCSGSA